MSCSVLVPALVPRGGGARGAGRDGGRRCVPAVCISFIFVAYHKGAGGGGICGLYLPPASYCDSGSNSVTAVAPFVL